MFNLKQELENYTPYDEDEKLTLSAVLDFLNIGDNCFDRSNLLGHITAGGLICDSQGNILLNHHKKSGLWIQFGGHADGNPDLLEVALREINEESGIKEPKLISNKIFDVDVQRIPFSAKKNEPEHWHFDINFLFFVDNHNFTLSDESTEARWVTIDEAFDLLDKDDKCMIRMIKKYADIISSKN